jgi:hypothetical protein
MATDWLGLIQEPGKEIEEEMRETQLEIKNCCYCERHPPRATYDGMSVGCDNELPVSGREEWERMNALEKLNA